MKPKIKAIVIALLTILSVMLIWMLMLYPDLFFNVIILGIPMVLILIISAVLIGITALYLMWNSPRGNVSKDKEVEYLRKW